MGAIAVNTHDFATSDRPDCNSDPLHTEDFDMRRPELPLTILNPDALTADEAEQLRRDGFTVPAAQPLPSIWK